MQEIEDTLKEAGLTTNEAKIYFSLFEIGKGNVAEIANKSKVHRVNVYDALKELVNMGLVSYFNIGKKRFYEPTDPEYLKRFVKEKLENIDKIIPQLKLRFEKSENIAQIFHGLDGIKRILEDMLIVNEKIQAFGIPSVMPEAMGSYLNNVFHRKRIQKKIHIQHIYNENAKERIAYLNKLKYCEAKYLPPEYNVPATTVIYGNKITFWVWSEEPFCVLIESEKMANAYRKYFNILWKMAKI